jgi:1-acyl-sn-glycerol-3-phosphate acyltransferase
LKVRHITKISYTVYCAITFVILGLTALVINSFLPSLRRRRQVAGVVARTTLRLAGIHLSVEGREHLPKEPCIVVANHASYIDGIVAMGALPPDFAFVIKKEMSRVPLAGFLLRRLGSEFVERVDRHQGAADARRVLRLASTGQSLVFFPEGTIGPAREISKFLGGAFTIASRSAMPVIVVAIHGTREVLPASSKLLFRNPIRFQILGAIPPEGARERSRQMIAQAVGEPLAT